MTVTDILFPRRCPVCGKIVEAGPWGDRGGGLQEGLTGSSWGNLAGGPWTNLICGPCFSRLSPVREPVCRKCGKELFSEVQEYCLECSRRPRSFDGGGALFHYNEAARRSLAAVKYRNRREYLDFYGAVMGQRFRQRVAFWKPEVLVPVPVHPSRRRRRGFNQAEELAVRLGRCWQIPVDAGLLIRSRKTLPQKDLNPAERLKNLEKAFAVPVGRQGAVPGSVLLIDDIYTTGSTVEACSRALRAAGVGRIHFLTVCIGGGG